MRVVLQVELQHALQLVQQLLLLVHQGLLGRHRHVRPLLQRGLQRDVLENSGEREKGRGGFSLSKLMTIK